MIKGVIFDLDNTIYDYDQCHRKAMAALERFACQRYAIDCQTFQENFEAARSEVKRLLGHTGAAHNRILYMQLFLENLSRNPLDGALELYDVYWNKILQEMEPFKYVLPLLQKLRERDIKIGILTNLTAQIQHRKIRRLGIAEYIDALITSEEAGCDKPTPFIFERIAWKLNLPPEELLMIGDNEAIDIAGAQRAGMHSLLFTLKDQQTMDKKVIEFIQ